MSADDLNEYLSTFEESSSRLLNIIDHLIEISKIDSGQIGLSITDVNINEQIEDIYSLMKAKSEQKSIEFSYKNSLSSEESNIKTDRDKLYSILLNLVDNAVKFTNYGYVDFGYEKTNGSFDFYIKDTGIGIANDRVNAIFNHFVQEDLSLSRSHDGAGLGLSIAKAYADMLGGKIWFESEKDKGTVFYFKLPEEFFV